MAEVHAPAASLDVLGNPSGQHRSATGRTRLSIAALGAAYFLLYVCTLTRFYTFDSIAYAGNIRTYEVYGTTGWLFHPHHLAFNSIGLLIHRTLQIVHPSTLSITALQIFTAFMGAVGVAAFACWMVETTGQSWLGLPSGAILGSSYGWWFASTDGRANVASAAMLIVVLWALGRARRLSSTRWCAAAGFLLGLTCLLHESHVFFLPVAILAAVLTDRSVRQRGRNASVLTAAFFATMVLPYACVLFGVMGFRSRGEVRHWLLSYGEKGIWWDFRVRDNLFKDVQALHKVFTGQDMVYGVHGHGLNFGGAWGGWATALWVVLWGLAIWGGMRGSWKLNRVALIAPLVALILYSAFFTIWTPGYFVFWLAQAAFLLGVMAVGWSGVAPIAAVKYPVMAAVPCLLAISYFGGIGPKTHALANPQLQLADRVKAAGAPGSLVVLSGMGWYAESEVYIPYFADMDALALHEQWDRSGRDAARATHDLRFQINGKLRGGISVFVLSDAFQDHASIEAMHERYGVSRAGLEGIFSPYVLKPVGRYRSIVIYKITGYVPITTPKPTIS